MTTFVPAHIETDTDGLATAIRSESQPAPSATTPRVLIVEDNPSHSRLIRELLMEAGLRATVTIRESLTGVSPEDVLGADCILLDLSLPDADGLEAVLHLRHVGPDAPIVVLSGRIDDDLALTCVRRGAQDYLPKPSLDPQLLGRSVLYAIERKRLEQELAHQALHDSLTGLPNRALFLDRLERALLRQERDRAGVAVFFIDLDGFKGLNDAHGHSFGDRVLVNVARALEEAVRPEDTVGRIGGDEFCVVCTNLEDTEAAVTIARRLMAVVGSPIRLGDQDVWITASIGGAMADASEASADQLLRDADAAMYRAKRLGKDRFEFAGSARDRRLMRNVNKETALRHAIENNQLILHYQPIIDTRTGGPVAVEALVRWAHPERGVLGPAEFIPLAERTGLVVPLGAWVLNEACRQAAFWRSRLERPLDPAPVISLNLAAGQLAHVQLAEFLGASLRECGLSPTDVWLEVTETGVMQDVETSIATLQRLRALGATISIDDFGSGYSSLAYLNRLPATLLKLDGALISKLGSGGGRGDTALVTKVVELAHALGMAVVAEGVETPSQLAAVRAAGCDYAQGYLISRPAPAPDLSRWWRECSSKLR